MARLDGPAGRSTTVALAGDVVTEQGAEATELYFVDFGTLIRTYSLQKPGPSALNPHNPHALLRAQSQAKVSFSADQITRNEFGHFAEEMLVFDSRAGPPTHAATVEAFTNCHLFYLTLRSWRRRVVAPHRTSRLGHVAPSDIPEEHPHRTSPLGYAPSDIPEEHPHRTSPLGHVAPSDIPATCNRSTAQDRGGIPGGAGRDLARGDCEGDDGDGSAHERAAQLRLDPAASRGAPFNQCRPRHRPQGGRGRRFLGPRLRRSQGCRSQPVRHETQAKRDARAMLEHPPHFRGKHGDGCVTRNAGRAACKPSWGGPCRSAGALFLARMKSAPWVYERARLIARPLRRACSFPLFP